jgi:hypothetical protein
MTGMNPKRRTDVVAIRPEPLRIDVFKNNGNAFDGGLEWQSEPHDYSTYLFRSGDIQADGRTDIIAIQPSPLRVVTWRNNGGSFDGGREWHIEPHNYEGYLFFAGDIDADGRADVIAVQQNPLRIVICRNNGSAFDDGREWHTEPYDYSGYVFFARDIDGGGKIDLIAVQRNPLRIVTWQNSGDNFDGGREWQTEPYDYTGYELYIGDIDGDGKADIVAVHRNPLRMVTWRNNGAGFDAGREWYTGPEDYSTWLVTIGDIDGDGKADVIAIHRSPLRMVTWRNNGSAFEAGREWFPPAKGPAVHPDLAGLFAEPATDPITVLMMSTTAETDLAE